MEHVELLIVGGGAAGMGAALGASSAGCSGILLVDCGEKPGGILLQCSHRGFGRRMTGQAYAAALAEKLPPEVRLALNTTVLSVEKNKTAVLSSGTEGLRRVSFDRLILATGCREIPPGALDIFGTRPRGVYTAGEMQARMNLDGYLPEGPVVILGSGDLGLVLSDQLREAGIPVTLVEKNSVCGGLPWNRKSVAEGKIPLLCGKTVTEIRGTPDLEAVVLSDGQVLPCKTFLTAVGLVPDRSLIRELGQPDWLYLCGNCSSVHTVVEQVVTEGRATGAVAYQNRRGAL